MRHHFTRFRCTFLTLLLLAPLAAPANCIDSIQLTVKPVQCFGLRNGELRIDTVFGGSGPFYYSLDGQNFSTNPHFEQLIAGEYLLYVRDAAGCLLPRPVLVPEPEELVVVLTADKTQVVAGEPFTLRAEVLPAGADLRQVSWRPPTLFANQNDLEQTLQISETTTFAIQIRDNSDCYARTQLTIHVEQTNLYFPNAIQPGSDQNAWFTAFAGEGVRRVLSLQVFSRNGGLMFERRDFAPNDPLKGWNGRWRNRSAQPGAYPWAAQVEYWDGTVHAFAGEVTVVR